MTTCFFIDLGVPNFAKPLLWQCVNGFEGLTFTSSGSGKDVKHTLHWGKMEWFPLLFNVVDDDLVGLCSLDSSDMY